MRGATVLITLVCLVGASCKSLRARSPGTGPEVALPPDEPSPLPPPPAPLGGLASVVAGDQRTCAVKKDGAVVCWGNDSAGQLGFLSTTVCGHDPCALIPTAVPFLSQIVQVALPVGSDANVEQSCARSSAGTATCWASTPDPRYFPPETPPRDPHRTQLNDIVDVAVGGKHACAADKTGHVLCWGMNGSGQLGFATTPDCKIFTGESTYSVQCAPEPRRIPGLDGVAALALGQAYSCARMVGGAVQCWGDNSYGQLGDGTTTDHRAPAPVRGLADVEELSAGQQHTCARKKDGSVWCWGLAEGGRLGNAAESCTHAAVPGWPRPCLRAPRTVPGTAGAVEVRAGRAHTCARRADGAIICWGDNSDGPLGVLPHAPDVPPTVVATFADAVQLSTGDRHTCVRRGGGTASCWGANAFGQLGDGSQVAHASPADVLATPRQQRRLRQVVEIAAGGSQTCARTSTGAVFCWGTNSVLGPAVNVATEVTLQEPVSGLAVGSYHACAHHPRGAVSCWGDNTSGQLGPVRTRFSSIPVVGGVATQVTAVAANGDQTCARTEAGKVICWGSNGNNQLGVATRNTTGPVEVPGVSDIVEVAVGGAHACARKNDGGVVCWGDNHYGQVGVAFGSEPRPPTVVAGVSNAIALAAGAQHTCALGKDGSVLCWGSDPYGELGYPSTTKCWTGDVCNPTPGPVRELPDAAEIAAGRGFTCARTKKGAVYCWGGNQDGVLGDGSKEKRMSPERVQHLSDVAQLSAGFAHACARTTDGAAWCWGANGTGQLGDGSTNARFFPWPVIR